MIIVIQCAASKRHDAGHLKTRDGKNVLFVADPGSAPSSDALHYARPDDPSDTGETWREKILHYNREPGSNPLGLCRAIDLYLNPAYARLAKEIGAAKTYILSAGWGLIRGDFLTPNYDITFSASAEFYKHRKKSDIYLDLKMLPEGIGDTVSFFGGKDYIPLFCELTKSTATPRTVFYNSGSEPTAPGCSLSRFQTTTRTNWHYECVNAFLDADPSRDR